MINIYNESHLHSTLKQIYSLNNNGLTEQKTGNFIFDIVTPEEIIEIQTSNISALTKKTEYLLSQNKKVRIVHPVIQTKQILTINSQGIEISKRKSPVSNTKYSILRGLTKIYPFLIHPLFTLELIYISVTEIHRQTEQEVQNFTKSRRHLRSYINTGKMLDSIERKEILKTREDYKRFIPENISYTFTPPQLKEELTKELNSTGLNKTSVNNGVKYYTLLIWILERMNIIENTKEKSGKSWIYKIV